jgi:hypothetical protein
MADDFDEFKVTSEAPELNQAAQTANRQGTSKPRQKTRHGGRFLIAPVPWIHHVTDVLSTPAQIKAAHHILFLVRLDKNPDAPAPVTVTAGDMRSVGVSAHVRDRALRQLEAAGLVTVKWQDKGGPIVTLRFDRAPSLEWKPALDAALELVTRRTNTWWWRPADLLAALERPTWHTGEWPKSVKSLLATVRQARPLAVVIRRGLRWIHLAPSSAE